MCYNGKDIDQDLLQTCVYISLLNMCYTTGVIDQKLILDFCVYFIMKLVLCQQGYRLRAHSKLLCIFPYETCVATIRIQTRSSFQTFVYMSLRYNGRDIYQQLILDFCVYFLVKYVSYQSGIDKKLVLHFCIWFFDKYELFKQDIQTMICLCILSVEYVFSQAAHYYHH